MWNRLYTVVFNRDWFAVVLIAILGLIVYYPVFGHDFQSFWDDQWVAVNGYTEAGLTYSNLKRILSEFYRGQYAPLNQLYYSTLYHFFGYNTFVFHTGSIVFHLLNAVLVYHLIRKLSPVLGLTDGKSSLVALGTALLFVVHPVAVESVAWIAASKVTIYAFFYLLALVIYIRYLQTGNWIHVILVGVFFVLSFGGKEQAVTLPICLFLLDYLYRRDLKSKRLYREKIPFFGLALVFGYITMLSQQAHNEGMLSDKSQYPFYQRIVFGSYAIVEYLTKCLVPVKLSYIYPFPMQIGEGLPPRFWIYPPICAVLLFHVYRNPSNNILIFWSSFFLLHLAVALHIIPIGRFTITADRYAYISLISICFSLSYLVICIWSVKPIFKYGILSLYILILSSYTIFRVQVWENTNTLKKDLRELLRKKREKI